MAGFSAGAQLLTRWAFFSPVQQSPSVRSIIGDPGTLLYFNSMRPEPDCIPLRDSGPDHSCARFLPFDKHMCPVGDWYKYGVHLANVTHNSYLQPFIEDPNKISGTIKNYALKDIRFMFGQYDICNCNAANFSNTADWCFHGQATCQPNLYGGTGCCDTYPDSDVVNAVDADCAGMLQGSNRLQRGLNFMSYLTSNASGLSFEPLFAVFPGGHDMQSCYNDSHFRAWAYDPNHRFAR